MPLKSVIVVVSIRPWARLALVAKCVFFREVAVNTLKGRV